MTPPPRSSGAATTDAGTLAALAVVGPDTPVGTLRDTVPAVVSPAETPR